MDTVRKAYIILAHKNEHQVQRLIKRLDDGLADFYLHIDLKSELKKKEMTFTGKANIKLIPSIRTHWGSFDLVQATINAMKAIQASQIIFDRISLLSGQDYPIKSNAYINNFFATSKHHIFMEYYSFPNFKKWPPEGGLYRIDKYFWGFSWLAKYAARTMNFLSRFFAVLKRRLYKKLKHYHGSQWWTIDNHSLIYMLDFVQQNPEYISFHKHTFAPDELFFQTILLNAPDARITGFITNNNKMFMKWADSESAHPEYLHNADFDEISNSTALFARKFDTSVDPDILDRIDEQLLTRS